MKSPLQSRTLWVIFISRTLMELWPWYKETVREFPELTYHLDGLLFFAMRLISKDPIIIKRGDYEVRL